MVKRYSLTAGEVFTAFGWGILFGAAITVTLVQLGLSYGGA